MNVVDIAKVCHEVNRSYCQSIGDNSQVPWDAAPVWQQESAIKGVEFHMLNPDSKPEDSHNSWLAEKQATGWTYGPVKDAVKKEHPCFVFYKDLPKEQQAKDYIFMAVVRALENRVPAVGQTTQEEIMQYFDFAHLPPKLQEISRPFGILAQEIHDLPRNAERSTALRKLLEAKDCAVRAAMAKKK